MAPSTSRAFASWTPLDLTSRISWPAGIAWIPPRLKAPVVNPFPYVYAHVSAVPPLRDLVVTFSHVCPPSTASPRFHGLRPEGKLPSVRNLRNAPSAAIPSRWIEHFLRFLRLSRVPVVDRQRVTMATVRKFRTRNENQTRIVGSADPFARAIPARSLARVSLCVRWLETKLVKQHPHVETWTFQRVYKVPLARPCRSMRTVFRLPLNDLSSVRALTFFSHVLVQI